MTRGLVGYTGFVGSNLLRAAPFDALFNSQNVKELARMSFDLLVVAGAPGAKWKANRDPAGDRAAVGSLVENLASVEAKMAVLVSTIDVYPNPVGVDEDTVIDRAAQQPYGRHRLWLEDRFGETFRRGGLIVRLPALFGPALKKNAIFDLLHHHETEKLNSGSTFQFYNIERLWADVCRFTGKGLQLVNVATEPMSLREVALGAFGSDFTNDPGTPAARYDCRSRYAALLGGAHGYLYDRAEVLRELTAFVASERAGLGRTR